MQQQPTIEQIQQMMGSQVPPRVALAYNFTTMMRGTSCKHIDHEKEFAGSTTIVKSKSERDAYAAAMELLRTFFNGENSGYSIPADFGNDHDGPPPAGVPIPPPVPQGGHDAAPVTKLEENAVEAVK
jgi:hypothetical protein